VLPAMARLERGGNRHRLDGAAASAVRARPGRSVGSPTHNLRRGCAPLGPARRLWAAEQVMRAGPAMA